MSFLARLLLLVLIAALFPVGIVAYREREENVARQAQAERIASLYADAVAAQVHEIVNGVRQLLAAVSVAPPVQQLAADGCRQYLAALERRDGLPIQISVLGPDGEVACSAGEALPGTANDRNPARAESARRTSRFTVDYAVDRSTGRPGLVLSYPVLDPSSRFLGVVTAPLPGDWLADRLARTPLPGGTVIRVFDEVGTILVDLPDRKQVGETVDLTRLPPKGAAAGKADAVMGYAEASLPGRNLRVSVGLPRTAIQGAGTQSVFRLVLLVAVGLALALLAAWLVGRFSLQRPLFRINEAARHWSEGDYAARTGLAGCSELDRLGQTFDRMAEALQIRDLERENYEQQLRRSRDEALRANEAKSRFLAAASHDLRQPLQALSMGVSVLEEKHRGDEQASSMISRLKRAVTSLTDLLNSLLDIAALEAGSVTPQMEDFRLGDVLRNVLEDFRHAAAEKGIDFRADACDVLVRSDPQHLGRMIRNLVDNAIKFTPAGGSVHIRCSRQDDHVRVQVADTGEGIPPEQQQAIFEQLTRLPDRRQTRATGLGLGLAVVERMRRLLGHPVQVESTPGNGTTFTIEVPAPPATEGEVAPGSRRAARGRILLVEDDAMVAEATEALLKTWGLEVVVARDAEEARAIIAREANPFGVVIADYRLPSASGLDVVANAILRWPTVKAAILTGDRESVSRETVVATGVHLLEKPIRASQLAELVEYPGLLEGGE